MAVCHFQRLEAPAPAGSGAAAGAAPPSHAGPEKPRSQSQRAPQAASQTQSPWPPQTAPEAARAQASGQPWTDRSATENAHASRVVTYAAGDGLVAASSQRTSSRNAAGAPVDPQTSPPAYSSATPRVGRAASSGDVAKVSSRDADPLSRAQRSWAPSTSSSKTAKAAAGDVDAAPSAPVVFTHARGVAAFAQTLKMTAAALDPLAS